MNDPITTLALHILDLDDAGLFDWNTLAYRHDGTDSGEDLILGYLDALRTYAPGFLAEHGVSLRLVAADRASEIRMEHLLTPSHLRLVEAA